MLTLFRVSRGVVVVSAVAGLVGCLAGGWLDYNTLSDNDAVRALAVRFIALVVAVVAGGAWSRSRGARSRAVAIASGTFFAASFIGAWIAPSIHPAGWSLGTIHAEVHGALSRADTFAAECRSELDGSLVSVSNVGLAGSVPPGAERLEIDLGIQSETSPGGGSVQPTAQLSYRISTGAPGTGTEFEYNPEAGVTVISAEGTHERGRLTFTDLPRLVKGDPSLKSDLPALSGTVDWTCEPAHDQPTPIEGTWFH